MIPDEMPAGLARVVRGYGADWMTWRPGVTDPTWTARTHGYTFWLQETRALTTWREPDVLVAMLDHGSRLVERLFLNVESYSETLIKWFKKARIAEQQANRVDEDALEILSAGWSGNDPENRSKVSFQHCQAGELAMMGVFIMRRQWPGEPWREVDDGWLDAAGMERLETYLAECRARREKAAAEATS
jgi:hypothetical protein